MRSTKRRFATDSNQTEQLFFDQIVDTQRPELRMLGFII
jgi:hypothetical protein